MFSKITAKKVFVILKPEELKEMCRQFIN